MIDPTIEQALAPSKEDWKEPLLAKFKNWVIGFSKAVCVVALGVAVGYGILAFGKDYLAHQKTIEAIQNPPSGSPEIGASPKNTGLGYGKSHIPNIASKNATDNIASKAINTPARGGFEGIKAPEFGQEKTEPETLDQLNARLEKINQQLLKGSL